MKRKLLTVFLIFIFAFAAGIMRYLLSCWFPSDWGTVFANFFGTFVLAFFVKGVLAGKKVAKTVLTALGVGLIGSLTTFASPVLAMLEGLWTGDKATFICDLLLYFCGGIIVVLAGVYFAEKKKRT